MNCPKCGIPMVQFDARGHSLWCPDCPEIEADAEEEPRAVFNPSPEQVRNMFAWLALAAAFVGDEDGMEEFGEMARRADAQCEKPLHPVMLDYQI